MKPRRHRPCFARAFAWTLLSLVLLSACVGEQPPSPKALRVAVFLELEGSKDEDGLRTRNFDWAVEAVNAAGGVAGRPLALDYIDAEVLADSGMDLLELAEVLAADSEHLAVVAPPGSEALERFAEPFIEAGKPLLSTTSTADELFRAYGGLGEIWRLRESDVVQAELLARFAHEQRAEQLVLLTSLERSTATFFDWFGFFTAELGYASEAVEVVTLDEACAPAVATALAAEPDMILLAASSERELACVVEAMPAAGQRPRIVLADTGIDASKLLELGAQAEGIEGFSAAGDEAFEAASSARFPGVALAAHGPGEYDAILLLAFGLERSGGVGGKPLIAGMRAVADADEPSVGDWSAAGVAATLAAMREGRSPQVVGATGPLRFVPERYMDLAASTLTHFRIERGAMVYGARIHTGDPSLLSRAGVVSGPQASPADAEGSTWTPAVDKSETWAVIAALSSGWNNYRHQADALRQYWLLREGGVDDEHIVLILADDLADAPDNALPGQVRNQLGGPDLRAGAQIDYGLELSPEQLGDILTGTTSEATPTVIQPGPSSNIYVYLVGHGGEQGMPIGALTAAEGLAGGETSLSPGLLRSRLCSLYAGESYRRVLVVIESCFAGVFGAAESGGIELGCGFEAGEVPLEGVSMITAADPFEVSYADVHDPEVPEWISDEFSNNFAEEIELELERNLADVYVDTYRATVGSHASLYNAAHAGRLTTIELAEFFSP
ncbi:Legumain [Plesiocystis pacifica SIR-1]|uniref:Legumain n=1 Tax=Plesiocystis pacifica SIR-1 TaxID=391625 RepID=A6GET6_9BACT|nr:C13 family peptidase [Plesiocystis pacifica]EDM75598.1 Legumain [Plesiocystis pacifica SIR-1]